MKETISVFDEKKTLDHLRHYLPAQAPLKDFIHHNTLHAFQHMKFFEAIHHASKLFGYKVSLSLDEYRARFKKGGISQPVTEKIITENFGKEKVNEWMNKMLYGEYNLNLSPRIGALRAAWKTEYKTDMDAMVQPVLFRVLCSYLDQGISIWNFPVSKNGFLASVRELERNSFSGFFKTKRAGKILLSSRCKIPHLLKILIGDEALYEQYLYDQQFTHQGWSGMVATVEQFPETLPDRKNISLHDVIAFELLLEIDALDYHFGRVKWKPLGEAIRERPKPLFDPVEKDELQIILQLWQQSFERSYYDEVLTTLQLNRNKTEDQRKSFQAMFCIDDRSCSLRRYIEKEDPRCETFGTPGFFGVEFYFRPENGKFYTKLCPAPVSPKHLILEEGITGRRKKDLHFHKETHSLFRGWIISQTLGFWSAFRLFMNIFRPAMSPATASSFRHMDKNSRLTIGNDDPSRFENGLQVGFTIEEMAIRVEALLKSIGLVKNFSPLVYVIGHGSSSVNNPHYAAYDCGACSGRPGSVNARVLSYMANKKEVRQILAQRGIEIPVETQFTGGLHDTTRDEIAFYDVGELSKENLALHIKNEKSFEKALSLNAKERSRRFVSVSTYGHEKTVHEKVKKRSVSLFEPRPELNHATNALCIIGRRSLTKNIFLDRRSFLNSYDYRVDPDGKYLLNILKAAAPVCGGINLEYFFSRTDNQKLGAGTKLPHNVMGLFGVANGIEGDLRPGLPGQMIEVHDPVRLLIVVEQYPEVVLQTIQKNSETYEWFINEWVNLAIVEPESKKLFMYTNGKFIPYETIKNETEIISDVEELVASGEENLHTGILN